jgi:hypothetical protein
MTGGAPSSTFAMMHGIYGYTCTVVSYVHTGILHKSLGFGVFAKIFSKNIVIPSKEIPFFGKAHQRFWAIITKFGFFGVLRMAESPNSVIWVTQITEYPNIWLFG